MKTWLMLIYGVSGIFAHKKTIKQFLQPMIEQVLGAGVDVSGGCATIFGSAFQSYYIFVLAFFNSPMPFLGRFYQYLHIFLLYIMCISSKSQTVFSAQNFLDVQLIPDWLWYCSFRKALLATNCLINGFSYSNNIFTKCLWGKTTEWSEIKICFKIYMVLNFL